MQTKIIRFKPITNNTLNITPYYRELLDPDYLSVFVYSSPQLLDIGGIHTPTHSFYSWYPIASDTYDFKNYKSYLQEKLPLNNDGRIKRCIKKLNDAHLNNEYVTGEFTDIIHCSGQIVAVEAYIEDIGGVAMINQSHNLIRTFAGNRLYKPSIIGHASNGWCRLKDAQHMIHQFTGR